MARIGYWRDGELGIFLNAEERIFLGVDTGASIGVYLEECSEKIYLMNMTGERTLYPLYGNSGVDGDIGWLRTHTAVSPTCWPRWGLTEIEGEMTDDGLMFELRGRWWSLPWPQYRGLDICREATIDYLKKCIITGDTKLPGRHVATQAVNYAKKGRAREYLSKIDLFIPASTDQRNATSVAQTHCPNNGGRAR